LVIINKFFIIDKYVILVE